MDRPRKNNENFKEDIYFPNLSDYDIFLFTPKDDKGNSFIQGLFCLGHFRKDLEELFGIRIDYDLDFSPTDFEIKNIDEETFYIKIRERFDLTVSKLTEVEKLANA